MKTNNFDEVKIQFEKFLSQIRNVLTSENEVNTIQNKLRRHFNTTTSDYLCSNEFLSLLNHIHNLFVQTKKPIKHYTELASLDEQLKKHSIKLSQPKSSSTPVQIDQVFYSGPPQSTIEFETSLSDVQETIDHLIDECCKNLLESTEKNNHSIDDKIPTSSQLNVNAKRQRKILKLERQLSRLSKIIRELEEKDMSLDEMVNCDLYVVESNLKKQACEIYTKITKLKSQSPNIERIIHQPIVLNESDIGHALISKDLEEMVNQSKHFPSFSDVLNAVEKANEKHRLHLNEENRQKFAEKSFKIIGKGIKSRRMADFQDIMYSRLPEDFNIEQNDPALNNPEIEKVLSDNHREAVIKTEKIFEEFAQIEPDPEIEINIELTENESDHEHEEAQTIAESQEIQYDVVDIVAPLSPEPVIQIQPESTSVDTPIEISLNDRPLTILSTASLPPKKPIHYDKDTEPKTLTPRHKNTLINNEVIYNLYQQRLTTTSTSVTNSISNKRTTTINDEYTNVKKSKQQQAEIIVLD